MAEDIDFIDFLIYCTVLKENQDNEVFGLSGKLMDIFRIIIFTSEIMSRVQN